MMCFMRLFSSLLLVLLLLLPASEMGLGVAEAHISKMGPAVAETKTCETPSKKFTGLCVLKANCDAICQTEGSANGHCSGFRRRCICTTHC